MVSGEGGLILAIPLTPVFSYSGILALIERIAGSDFTRVIGKSHCKGFIPNAYTNLSCLFFRELTSIASYSEGSSLRILGPEKERGHHCP